ncbi:hypothetical protein VNO78_03278 [Psophocarpus tetragonolobus]|uniref:Uncharacterized protein n=1 Tax=Psophocarpus tetragonolobus TaxID=3891 RepID=A0AAN9T1X4_PSOTE
MGLTMMVVHDLESTRFQLTVVCNSRIGSVVVEAGWSKIGLQRKKVANEGSLKWLKAHIASQLAFQQALRSHNLDCRAWRVEDENVKLSYWAK